MLDSATAVGLADAALTAIFAEHGGIGVFDFFRLERVATAFGEWLRAHEEVFETLDQQSRWGGLEPFSVEDYIEQYSHAYRISIPDVPPGGPDYRGAIILAQR